MNSRQFYSNGKLLLTSEYLVLNGATGLAIPTEKGQSLAFKASNNNILNWTSLDCNDQIWFKASFNLTDFGVQIHHGRKHTANTLQNLLQQSQKLNPSFLKLGGEVSTRLNFERNWGLGSSSTLINNIAKWAKIDPYRLLWSCFKGSGYDIACADAKNPILYTLNRKKAETKAVQLTWNFTANLFFVHLNQKQDTTKSLKVFKEKIIGIKQDHIKSATQITSDIVKCNNLSSFEYLITEHEALLSNILSMPTVKESLFKDFGNAIKSLGAWGGDFILATGTHDAVKNYFESKGYKTIIPFENMIL